MHNLVTEPENRKVAALLLCKLVHDNSTVAETLCSLSGSDLIYDSDGIARVSLNKIPRKLTNLLRNQGHNLKLVLNQISKI